VQEKSASLMKLQELTKEEMKTASKLCNPASGKKITTKTSTMSGRKSI
jgi:hypothetical protein